MAIFFAILPAGGIGKRMNLAFPKQLYKYKDKPLFYYTLMKFYSDLHVQVLKQVGFEGIV